MSEHTRPIIEMPLSEARLDFSECVNKVHYGAERIVVTSHGKPKAAIVPIKDLRRLQELEQACVEQTKPVSA